MNNTERTVKLKLFSFAIALLSIVCGHSKSFARTPDNFTIVGVVRNSSVLCEQMSDHPCVVKSSEAKVYDRPNGHAIGRVPVGTTLIYSGDTEQAWVRVGMGSDNPACHVSRAKTADDPLPVIFWDCAQSVTQHVQLELVPLGWVYFPYLKCSEYVNCVVADPTGTPLNIHSLPNGGKVMGTIKNEVPVIIGDEVGKWAFIGISDQSCPIHLTIPVI